MLRSPPGLVASAQEGTGLDQRSVEPLQAREPPWKWRQGGQGEKIETNERKNGGGRGEEANAKEKTRERKG